MLITKNNLSETAVWQIVTEQHNRLTNIFAIIMKHYEIFEIKTEHRTFKWCNLSPGLKGKSEDDIQNPNGRKQFFSITKHISITIWKLKTHFWEERHKFRIQQFAATYKISSTHNHVKSTNSWKSRRKYLCGLYPFLLYPFFTTLLQFLNALLANKGLLN